MSLFSIYELNNEKKILIYGGCLFADSLLKSPFLAMKNMDNSGVQIRDFV